MKPRFLTFLLLSLISATALAQAKKKTFTANESYSTLHELNANQQLNSYFKQLSENILIQIQPEIQPGSTLQMLEDQFGLVVKKSIAPQFGFYLLGQTNRASDKNLAEELALLPHILSAQYDSPVQFRDTIPNDPQWPGQWDMVRIGLPDVWSLTTGGQTDNGHEIVVAVLDSGFDITHEDLQGNIWVNEKEATGTPGVDDDGNGFIDDFNGWNFISDSNILGVTGHGTSVTGLIGGKGNNGIGMAGVNWNVKMMFCNVDLVSEVVAAFAYVIEQRQLYNSTNGAEGAFVVVTNGSFGKNATFCSEEPAWGAMYDLLGEVGILNVAATANENWDVEEVGDMPTTCGSDFLVSVTGTDINDERVSNSAFGQTSIDLAAPGRETISTTLDDRYNENFGGTSAACPHVAGAVALLYSLPCTELGELALADPPAAALLMRDALLKNVFPIASLKGKTVTEGRVDVFESMKYLHAWCIGNETDRASEHLKDVYLGQRGLVRISPNPVSTLLTVDFSAIDFGNEATFQVFNMLGQEIQLAKTGIAKSFEKQQVTFDVTDWHAGIYIINIIDKSQKISQTFYKL